MTPPDCWIVVPHAGTWIEIGKRNIGDTGNDVVPHAGTWIEIVINTSENTKTTGRSPRGNVD